MIPPLIIAGIAGASAIGLLRQRIKSKTHPHDVNLWADLIEFHDPITPSARLADGTPLLIEAIKNNNVHIVEELLKMNFCPDVCTPDAKPALFHILKFRNERARQMLTLFNEHHANFNIMDSRGNTALFYADSPKLISFLCKCGTLINAQNAEGKTALHSADLFKTNILLNNGADPNIQDKNGQPPLHLANTIDVMDSLLEHGATPDIRDNNGQALLHLVKSSDIVFKLLKHKANKNIQNIEGKTPLHLAVQHAINASHEAAGEYYKIAELLLNSGADPNIQDNEGKTPLHLAIAPDKKTYSNFETSKRFIKLLLQNGAKLNIQDKAGNTPLHLTHYLVILELLLQNGANPNIQNYKGQTPLRMAQSPESRDLLLKYGAICN